jgi:hypothetical protein
MADTGIRRSVWLGVAGTLAVLAAVVVVLENRRAERESTPPSPIDASARPEPGPTGPAALPQPDFPRSAPRAPAEQEPVPYIEGLVWGDIDLRGAQAVMPDNLYWKLGAPTKDPAVLAEREEEKKHLNERYGRVLSGDASEEEVNEYYDYRTRVSADFLELAEFLQRSYGDGKNEQFRGLLELAVQLHAARLAQIPADREAAIEHSRTRAKIREEWRNEQAEFGELR